MIANSNNSSNQNNKTYNEEEERWGVCFEYKQKQDREILCVLQAASGFWGIGPKGHRDKETWAKWLGRHYQIKTTNDPDSSSAERTVRAKVNAQDPIEHPSDNDLDALVKQAGLPMRQRESELECAQRETKEEIGIHLTIDQLQRCGNPIICSKEDSYLYGYFRMRIHDKAMFNNIQIDQQEIVSFKWLKLEELLIGYPTSCITKLILRQMAPHLFKRTLAQLLTECRTVTHDMIAQIPPDQLDKKLDALFRQHRKTSNQSLLSHWIH